MSKTFLFPTIQFCQTALIQTIQFSISMQLVLFKTLSGATIPGRKGPGSNSNKEVLRSPQISSITKTLPSDCLVSYPGHSLGAVLALCRGAVDVFNSFISDNSV